MSIRRGLHRKSGTLQEIVTNPGRYSGYMGGTLSRSFQLVKESFAVLKQDKKIIWFPIVSLMGVVLLFISFAIPLYLYATNNYFYILLFLFYLLSYFVVIFFNSGLITCAHMRLNGGETTFGDGFKNARSHLGGIFV